jgi:formyltetrahydrofolate deformylase
MTQSDPHYALVAHCPDTKGIVAAVSGYLADNDASIVEASQFNDRVSNFFCMRTVFKRDGARMPPIDVLKRGFEPIAHRFSMTWRIADMSVKPRLVIAVSKFGHCLYDLLHRWRSGVLPVEVVAVVSNHEDMRAFTEWNGVPFHYLPVTADNRPAQEARFKAMIDELGADFVVLARYMQVLSKELCARLAGRCINIHHSFLPSFRGAKPYQQAYAHGVKIIGATAHYVTAELDHGPIIEQAVERVNHTRTPEDLIEIGRDIECTVLARAVRWHAEQRIILNGQRTIVFD